MQTINLIEFRLYKTCESIDFMFNKTYETKSTRTKFKRVYFKEIRIEKQ